MVGSIDPRREAHRRGHWHTDAAGVFGPRIADTILASGHVRPRPKGRTYDRKRSHPKSAPRPLQAGAVHIWPLARSARKPGALRNGAPFKHWVLPAGLDRVKRKLAGVDDGDRQMVAILSAVMSDGLPAVEAACLEALKDNVHSADVIINILARQREPAAAITIMTAEALRLQHEPAADCARYDSLRRTV